MSRDISPAIAERAAERAAIPQDNDTQVAWWRHARCCWRGEEGAVIALARRVARERGVDEVTHGDYFVEGSVRSFCNAWVKAPENSAALRSLIAWPFPG
jgi:hypothetical protein